jgi:DNA anti-recombination protein RmuC
MAGALNKARCVICGKERSTVRCEGCSQTYCLNDLEEHRQELSKQFDEVEVTRDLFRQTLMEQTTKRQNHELIQQIDQWEHDSINKIRQTAEETRQLLRKHTDGFFTEIQDKLNKLTNQLQESRKDFFETDLQQWKEQLEQLKENLDKPLPVAIRHDSTPLVTKIFVDVTGKHLYHIRIEKG